ncbi:MAG: DUF3000 domain-containing protein [Motilibacteraceae bacterium]
MTTPALPPAPPADDFSPVDPSPVDHSPAAADLPPDAPRVVALPAARIPAVERAAPRGVRRPRTSRAYAPGMTGRSDAADTPETFRAALASLREVAVRPEVVLSEAPAPQRLAPYAVALTADVVVEDEELATGRLVVLHDPAGHEAWGGSFRVVTFVRADVDPEVAADPVLAEVGWTWLEEALSAHGLVAEALSGTVTRVTSQGFGGMADKAPDTELEVRASWTPDGPDVGPHLLAWTELLCTAAGLPPMPPGVTPMPSRRGNRLR